MKLTKYLMPLLAIALAVTPLAAQDAETGTPPAKVAKASVKKETVTISRIVALPAVMRDVKKNNSLDSFERIAQSMPDSIGNYILATRKLDVVPCDADIEQCINAIDGSTGTLTDVGEEIVAKFRAVNYPISVTINDYQDKFYQDKIRGELVKLREIRFGATVKLLDSKRGIIKISQNISVEHHLQLILRLPGEGGGDETEKVFSETADKLCRKIAFSIVDFIAPAKIIGVNKKGVATINKGRDTDIEKGQIYDVFEVGEEMIDPDTGESLGKEETLIGKIKVIACQPKVSRAKIISQEEDYEIGIGNVVRLTEPEEKRRRR